MYFFLNTDMAEEEVPHEIRRAARLCGEMYDRISLYHVYEQKLKQYMQEHGFTTMVMEGQKITLEDGMLYFSGSRFVRQKQKR